MQVDDFERRYPQGLLCGFDDIPEGCGAIYMITNLINEKVYIGQTWCRVPVRWKQHQQEARYGKKCRFYNALRKYGENSFCVGLLGKADSQKELDNLESLWILTLNSINPNYGYNSKYGGLGGKLSLESRNKLSKTNRKRLETQEARERVSVATKIALAPPEIRRKISERTKSGITAAKARREQEKIPEPKRNWGRNNKGQFIPKQEGNVGLIGVKETT